MIELCLHFPRLGFRIPGADIVSFLGFEPGKFACMAVFLSTALGSLVLLFAGPALAFLSFFSSIGFFVYLPCLEKSRRARELETELPLFLRSLGMLLEFGVPLERSLELASDDCGALSREIRVWTGQMRDGLGARSALQMMALQYDSVGLKRAVSSLLLCLESGSRGTEISRMGDDMLLQEQHRMREYASRSAIFGLLLIVVSAIMPTFFLLYSASGMGRVEEGQMAMAMLVLFPVLSLFVILLSRAMMPRMLFSPPSPDPLRFAPGALVVAGYLFPAYGIVMIPAGVLCGGYVLWKTFGRERRAEELERGIPDALFSAGGMPRSSRPDKLFGMIAEGGYGALSEEAAKSRSQLDNHVPLNSVLDDLWRRNRSGMLRRSCMMLRQMIDSGALDRIGILADDMIRHLQLRRERAASFSMQKYTLLSGALIIPLIMKITLGLLSAMGGATADIAAMAALVPPYLVIYSAIGSAAIGEYEGKGSSAVAYMALMASCGLLGFHFINF